MYLPKDEADSPKIVDFPFPFFYLLNNVTTSNFELSPSGAVFLGNDFKNMSKTLDRPAYIRETNKCLDYMRRECRECKLYYKPHPNETDESSYFNLDSFEIIAEENNDVAEIFFWKNLNRIKYVFSIASTAVWSAYNLGLNAYTFIHLVAEVAGKDLGSALDYFNELPSSFFINDYRQTLRENKKTLKPDLVSESYFVRDLERSNEVWLVTGDPGMIGVYVAFTRLVRKHFPGKKVNLIIPRHPRWDSVKEQDYRQHFDRVVVFPRSLYSLRPLRLISIIRTVVAVKGLKLDPGDILLLFANTNLVENCFLSYFKNKKIAVQFKDYFEINYGLKESEILRGKKLRSRFTTKVFNKILEPLLGLYRTTYLEYGDGRVINRVRFFTPATKVYDRIYLLS